MLIKDNKLKDICEVVSPEKLRKKLTEMDILNELADDMIQTNVFEKLIMKNPSKEKDLRKIEYWFKKATGIYYFVNKNCEEAKDSKSSKDISNVINRKNSSQVFWGKN